MKELLKGILHLPLAIGLLLQSIFHLAGALKTYGLAKRLENDKRLYELLNSKTNLTQEEQSELQELIKTYKKTFKRVSHVDSKTK